MSDQADILKAQGRLEQIDYLLSKAFETEIDRTSEELTERHAKEADKA